MTSPSKSEEKDCLSVTAKNDLEDGDDDDFESVEDIRERIHLKNAASKILSSFKAPMVSHFQSKTESNRAQAFLDVQAKEYKENGVSIGNDSFYQSHPMFDPHPCAECQATNVFTRVYFNKNIHRSFFLCRNCAEDFQLHKGFEPLLI